MRVLAFLLLPFPSWAGPSAKLCERFVQQIAPLTQPAEGKAFSWLSSALQPGALKFHDPTLYINRVGWIVASMFSPKSPIAQEFDRMYRDHAAEGVFEHYLAAYERLFLFSPSYQNTLLAFHRESLDGAIADFGCGTGTLGCLLGLGSAKRRVGFFDVLRDAAPLVSARYQALSLPGANFTGSYGLPENSGPFRTVVANHVFYTNRAPGRSKLIASLAAQLASDGRLILNEPAAVADETPAEGLRRYQSWLARIMVEGLTHGSPASDFDIALLAAFSVARHTRDVSASEPTVHFLSRDELIALAARSGLVELPNKRRRTRITMTYDGFSNFILFEKPRD